MNKILKQLSPADLEIRSVDERTRTIRHRVSREVPDRMGDIVRIGGGDFTQFAKKPAVLYGHDYTGKSPIPVIAENVGFKVEGDSLYAGTKFLNPETPGLSQALRDLINDNWILHRQRLLGWSIGFIPLEAIEIKDERGRVTGHDYKRWTLLEYSSVVIPAHQDAINDCLRRGVLSRSFQLYPPRGGPFYYREMSPEEVNHSIRAAALRVLEFTIDATTPGTGLRSWGKGVGIQWISGTSSNDPRAKHHGAPVIAFVDLSEKDALFVRADVPYRDIERAIPHEFSHLLRDKLQGKPLDERERALSEAAAEARTESILSELWGDAEYARLRSNLPPGA